PEDRHVNTSSRSPRVPLRRDGAGGKRRTPAAACQASFSHSDNGRLSTPWREVIFLSTVMDSLFDASSPALVYEPKSASRRTIGGQEVRHADQRDNRRFLSRRGREPCAGGCRRARGQRRRLA